MLSLREYMILESCNYDYILEALGGTEIRKNLEISEISYKEVEKLIISKEYGGGKQFGIDNIDNLANNIWAFKEVTHYTFKYKGDILAIIGVENLYNILKAQRDFYDTIASTLFVIPLLVLNDISLENISIREIVQKIEKTLRNDEKSEDEIVEKLYDIIKKSLYVCELQINKETIKKHDLSIIAPLMIVFDWVKKYSNDNWIVCGGKDERTANMYKKVGKFWNITLNDKYSKKINEYVKEWSKKEDNTGTLKRRSLSERIFDDNIKDHIKRVCILKK